MRLLLGHRHQPMLRVIGPSERRHATGELAARLLPLLGRLDALGNPVALELRERPEHGEEQLALPVAGHRVGCANVEQEQVHAALLQLLRHLEAIEQVAREAVELGHHQVVAALEIGPEPAALGALCERDPAGDAASTTTRSMSRSVICAQPRNCCSCTASDCPPVACSSVGTRQ
jgi:hypothetical protein